MSLKISRAEGVTVYTIHSKRKSKWPLICQILGTMCYSPMCSVSRSLKQELSCVLTVLATIQIMVGIMNLGLGSLSTAIYYVSDLGSVPLWLGGVIIAIGIMCILAEKFPSPCLVFLTVLMNIVSAALAITTIVIYSVDLAEKTFLKLFGGLDIMMIVLSVLHLCVTISWCALNIKALCKKQADAQDLEDPELRRSLMEEEDPDFAC
ncbi:hypothetical protein QTP86_016256 [Hemibagrus guttatus]|nr:hypothetical protein QTP86_016256 [Hemibagrus guttatus]